MGQRRSYQEVASDPDAESIDGRLPNFLVVGAQRGGTTWLYECLRAHPEVYVPDTKEVNFFSDIGAEKFPKGVAWYKGFFEETISRHRAIGEITPEYLLDEKAPFRIRETLGAIKIIIVVRNPVERAYSSYGKGIREGDWSCSFSDFFQRNLDFCIERGMYWQQLSRYLEHFSEERILVKVYEDLLSDPHSYIWEVFNFLGVQSDFVPPTLMNRFNIGVRSQSVVTRSVVFARDIVYSIPLLNKTVKMIQRTAIGNRIMQRVLDAQGGVYKNRELEGLRAVYAEDVYQLSNYLSRDLNEEWGIPRPPNAIH